MSENVSVSIDETVEQINIDITEQGESTVQVTSTEVKEDVTLEIFEGTYKRDEVWINLASGWDIEPTQLQTSLPGEVYQYKYKNNSIYFRYIANDLSVDAFYENFVDPNLTGLIVTRRI